jgi:hypothetical protein
LRKVGADDEHRLDTTAVDEMMELVNLRLRRTGYVPANEHGRRSGIGHDRRRSLHVKTSLFVYS